MKGMKSLAMILALSAIAENPHSKRVNTIPGKLRPVEPVEPPIEKGLKRFIIDGVGVWALNEKNAIRKAKKKKQ